MKRARPKNKKAAQKMMRKRELEYLRRQHDESQAENGEEIEETSLSIDETPASAADADTEQEIDSIEDYDTAEASYDEEEAIDSTEADEEADASEEEELDEEADEQESDEEDDIIDSDDDLIETDEDADDSDEEEKPQEDIPAFDTGKRTDIDLDLPKRKKKKPKKSIAKRIFITLISVMLALIALIFIVLGFGLFDDTEILAPLEEGKINVLLMGVDESGLRTDAIMVASYDVNEGKINMLSIPRDTKIYVENRRMTRKINEIHALGSTEETGYILGTQAIAETVTQLTGIPINYYVEFSFASIDHLFDILGPVEFDVPDVEGDGDGMNYDDPYQNLHIHLKPGLQELSGNQIQQFLRYRKSNSGKGTGSDTDRVVRQQAFIKAVIDQKVNLSTLLKLPTIYSQLSREIKTNISLNDIMKYVRYLNKLSGEGITSYSLPGEAKTVGGGSYFVADLEALEILIRDTFGFEAEISDRVTLTETNPQKPLKVTNITVTPEPTKAPTKEPEEEEVEVVPTKAPTKAPTKEPTKAPVVTKAPTKEPTKAPTVTKEPDDEIIILE